VLVVVMVVVAVSSFNVGASSAAASATSCSFRALMMSDKALNGFERGAITLSGLAERLRVRSPGKGFA
jgi:hypothetical protein